MKKSYFGIFLVVLLFIVHFSTSAYAMYDPRTLPNNKFGVHILFPSELDAANQLINSNGGQWGYVTIPIQISDKNIEKWQAFMDECKKYKIIPLLRIATENYYFNTPVWKKPSDLDISDFANFLNSLSWPTKNRYVIVFNEVNRADEWQGEANPAEYAQILSLTVDEFKKRSDEFFIISSGLDNAAATLDGSYNQYQYLREMGDAVPDIFDKIDGLGSHSYPNPAFAQAPSKSSRTGVASYVFEKNVIRTFTDKDLPVFITETGWSSERVQPTTIASYFRTTFQNIWNDKNVIAVTPFLLTSGPGPFEQFTLVNANGSKNPSYEMIQNLTKIKGEPEIPPPLTLSSDTPLATFEKDFSDPKKNRTKDKEYLQEVPSSTEVIFKWLMKID